MTMTSSKKDLKIQCDFRDHLVQESSKLINASLAQAESASRPAAL